MIALIDVHIAVLRNMAALLFITFDLVVIQLVGVYMVRERRGRSAANAVATTLLAVTLAVTVACLSASAMGSVGKRYDGSAPQLEEWVAQTWPVELVDEAIQVAWCESRGKPTARNGQYMGLMQMGRREWAKYGKGKSAYDPIANLEAAYRYYQYRRKLNGNGWAAWQCSPMTEES